MSIFHIPNQALSLYNSGMDSKWFSVSRYYSITYSFFDMGLLHSHAELEIMYIVSGKCTINIEGGSILFQEGDYIFLDSFVPHSLTVEKGNPCRLLNLEIELVEATGVFRIVTLAQEDAFSKLRDAKLPFFYAKDEETAVKNGILNLHRMLQLQASPLETGFQFSLILMEISRQCFLDRKKKPQGTPPYVKRAVQFINENFDHELSICKVAEAADISKAHLQRAFLKYEGCTIVDAINRLRLGKARFLLVTSDIPIVEIANEVGFSSRQYFTGLFTRANGLSPASYRVHQRGNIRVGFDDVDTGIEAP